MNKRELKELIELFESSSLSRIKLDKGDVTIELEKPMNCSEGTASATRPATKTASSGTERKPECDAERSHTVVKAPLVGTYYEAPAPEQPPFVRMGQNVQKGDVLCIIEAMKVMNEITAPKTGKVMAIHSKNGEMVMYDQVIMEID